MSTFETLKTLQSEASPRRAGSDGERVAQAWLKAQCERLGLAVEMDEFTFVGSEHYRPLMQLAIMAFTAACILLVLNGQGGAGWIGLMLMFVYLNFFHKHLELRLAHTRSQNVIAGLRRPISEYVASAEKGPAFLVCAHYDTARNMPAWLLPLRDIFRILGPLAYLGILLCVFGLILQVGASLPAVFGAVDAAFAVARIGGWLGTVGLVFFAPGLLVITLLSLYNLVSRKTDSLGADDNGSGAALVLEMARRFKENPPQNAEVFFAWWGAEERGLFGSRQFVRRFHSQLDRNKLYLINVDCVGVGEMLTVNTGQGLFKRRPSDPQTVQRLEALAARLGIRTIRSWESPISGGSSDHAEWIERGYTHTISLIREGYRPLSLPARLFAFLTRIPDANQLELKHIHSTQDTLEVIRPEVLQETTELAEAYIREIDAELAQ